MIDPRYPWADVSRMQSGPFKVTWYRKSRNARGTWVLMPTSRSFADRAEAESRFLLGSATSVDLVDCSSGSRVVISSISR